MTFRHWLRQNWQSTLLVLSCLTGFLISVYFWYPGSLSADSFGQMAQANTGNYRDHHPTIMAFLWRILNLFSAPPENLFFFYMSLLWASLCGISLSLRKSIGLFGAFLITLIGLFPSVFGMSGVLWKDIGFGVSLLAAIHYTLRLRENFNWIEFSLFLLSIFYTVNIRHNGYFAVVPFLALTLTYLPPRLSLTKKRIVLLTIILPLLLKFSYSAFEAVALKPFNEHIIQHLQFADLNGLSSRLKTDFVNDEMKLKPYTLEEMSMVYYKDHRCSDGMNYAGYLRIVQDSEVRSKIFENWLSVISSHPKEYLKHRWRYFKGQLGIGYGPCRSYHFYFDKRFDSPSESRVAFRNWMGRKFNWMDFRTPFFAQWFYLALSGALLLFTPLVVSRLKWLYVGALVSGITYYLPYFFISLCCDFRYVWWTILSSLLAFCILTGSLVTRAKVKILATLALLCFPMTSFANPYFSDTYNEAKDKFLMACSEIDGSVFEDFSVNSEHSLDTCRKTHQGSKTLIILSSGVHGVEGFVGSAIQLKFLDFLRQTSDTKFDSLILHGINPWGFSNLRRTTESNVDLNRNFVLDEEVFQTRRPSYNALNTFLNPENKASTGPLEKVYFLFKSALKILTHGMKPLRQAILEGQYQFDEGIFFGGRRYEPQVQIIRDVLRVLEIEMYETILVFDLHSGYGERGKVHLFPDQPASEVEKQKLIEFFDGYELNFGTDEDFYEVTGEFATYLSERLKRSAPDVSVFPMVIEVGTMDSQTTLGSVESLRRMVSENQGYFHGFESEEDQRSIQKDFLEMFNPPERELREKVLSDSLKIIRHSLERSAQF